MDWHAPTDMPRQVATMNWGCNINESWKDAAPARGNSYAYKPRLEQLILRPAQMDERINCNYGCQTPITARLRKSKRVCEQILKQRTRRQVFCSTFINFDPKWNTNWIWYDCNFKNLRKQRTLVDARSCVRPTNDVAFGIYMDTHAWIHCQRWSWYFQHWPAAFKTSCEASAQEPPAVLVLRRCPHTCERREQHSAHRAWDANFIHVISYEQLLMIFYAMLCMQYIDAVTWYYH